MENNKYYTPTIEEFHIGFEYIELGEEIEISLKPIFNVHILETPLALYTVIRLIEESYGAILVKYLDEIDLLSLGFIFDEYTSKQYSIINKDGDTYSIDFDCLERTNSIRDGIGIIIYNDIIEQLFIGYIKNKSELKLLLSQLNIL